MTAFRFLEAWDQLCPDYDGWPSEYMDTEPVLMIES